MSDIELPALIQQRLLYVFLYYVCLRLSVLVLLSFYEIFQSSDVVEHVYPTPSVAVLSGLYDPYILDGFYVGQSGELSQEIFEARVVLHGFDVICLRKRGRCWLDCDFVVESQMVEQSFLVA